MMKLLFFILCSLLSSSLMAFGGNSLTWQKLALEEKLQKKYAFAIGNLLKDGQYLIEVETQINEPSGPNFGNNSATGTKVSDISIEESRGDYVAFSKVGLEVPVVEKFLDEDKTKLTNIFRYNEAFDLFKSIESIKITIFLSDKIPADLQEVVKKVAQNLKVSIADIKPEIKFEQITMEWVKPEEKRPLAQDETPKKLEETEPKIWAKDWFEWASRWGNAVGLILGALIVGFIALSLFKQWKAFMEKFTALAANKEENSNPEEENKEVGMTNAQNATQPMTDEEEQVAINKGFERFQQCLEQHPDEAINIVRNLLNEGSETSELALRGLAQQISSSEMEKILVGLSPTLRDKWKACIKTQLEPAELLLANKYIFQEVIHAFLVPTKIKDNELLNLVMDLNAKSTISFMQQYGNQIGILMNLISPGIINKILASVSDEVAEDWLLEASSFSMKSFDDQVSSLKKDLTDFQNSQEAKPFLQRIAAMIPAASPTKEKTLYKALAQSGDLTLVQEVAQKHFPSELILKLPSQFLKETMQIWPMHKRLELLQSQEEEIRATLIDILAEPGSAARDMIDMELENIQQDQAKKALIEERMDEIWQEFVKTSRTMLTKNASYNSVIQKLVQEWSEKLKTHLKAIEGGKVA